MYVRIPTSKEESLTTRDGWWRPLKLLERGLVRYEELGMPQPLLHEPKRQGCDSLAPQKVFSFCRKWSGASRKKFAEEADDVAEQEGAQAAMSEDVCMEH